MPVWDEIVKCALVGVERHAPSFDSAEEPLAALLAQLDGADRERSLLRAVAMLAPYRRAGRLPSLGSGELPQPAPADDRKIVPAPLLQDLLVLLSVGFREALEDWLEAASARNWRLPDEHLSSALAFGATHRKYRSALLSLLGPRGRWLAARNSEWKYALEISLFEIETSGPPQSEAPHTDAIWDSGAREERVALVRDLRRTDPRRARALVESTWHQEPPDLRATFLATLDYGICMEDEPFLESALDDKRKEVRAAAQRLLPRLTESRHARRMWERCREYVRLEPNRTGFDIVVTLPASCDKAMIRDGIDPKPQTNSVGERAWWLRQILERTPLPLWQRECNRTPGEILSATFAKGDPKEWRLSLLEGWSAALKIHPDPDWAATLFRFWIEETHRLPITDIPWPTLMPAPEFEAGILRLMEKSGKSWNNEAHELLMQYRAVWSAEFSRAILKRFRVGRAADYYIAAAIAQVADCVPEEAAEDLTATWAEIVEKSPYAKKQLDGYLELKAFRTEMRRKFAAAQEH